MARICNEFPETVISVFHVDTFASRPFRIVPGGKRLKPAFAISLPFLRFLLLIACSLNNLIPVDIDTFSGVGRPKLFGCTTIHKSLVGGLHGTDTR